MNVQKSTTQQVTEKLQPDSTKSDHVVAEQTLTGKVSDAASHTRQGPMDQAKSAIQPQSSKTLGDKASDTYDTVASAVTPEGNKTTGERAADSVNPDRYGTGVGSDGHATAQKPGLVQQAKDAVNNALGTSKQ